MKRIALLVLITISLAPVGGCITRAAKEVFLSPKGLSVPTQQPASQSKAYSKVQFEDFSNAAISIMPAHMNDLMRTALSEEIGELKPKKAILDPAASRVLTVRGQYVYYEENRGILDQAFGPFEEIIAIVELVDQPSGQIVARGYCVGRTNTTKLQGPKRKAEGLSKAIIDLIRKSCRMPIIRDD